MCEMYKLIWNRKKRSAKEGVSEGVGGTPEFLTIVTQQLQNLLPAMLAQTRTLSREVALSMSWDDFKFMMIEEFCPSHEMQKVETELWNHAMVEACHVAYTNRFHKLAMLVPYLVTPESRKIEGYVYGIALQIHKMVKKKGNVGKPKKDKNDKDDNKRTRTGNVLASTTNPVRRENTGNQVKDRSFILGAEEARKDPNIMTVRITLLDGKVLRVLGERPKGKVRPLMSAKASDKKQGDIVMVRDFPEVFLNALSGLPTLWEIKFLIELIHRVVPVTKSPYRLAPSELEELSGQHKELQDKGPELVQETNEKISQIKDRLKDARDRQKSYADKRRKPLKFSVGDYVLLKVSPWKGVMRFGTKGQLAPRFVGPFEIVKKLGPVAYRLDLPEELNGVHDTFYVSNLKKCLADPTLQVPLDEI
nr:putative reverse transcriptase domain-containing protein [Tanacetum cinerariifolium]